MQSPGNRLPAVLLLSIFTTLLLSPRSMSQERNDPALGRIVAASIDLGFSLAPRISAEGNAFFSPASISSALLMAYAGSRGETAQEMAEAMHLAGFEPTDAALDRAAAALVALLNRDGSTGKPSRRQGEGEADFVARMTLINALWGQEGHPFRTDYLTRLSQGFGSKMRALDFITDPEGSRKVINEAIARDTMNKIRDLLPEGSITPLTRLVLTNAIYFKNAWAESFTESATREQAFESRPNMSFMVPMMRRTGSYGLAENDSMRMLRLPYAGGHQSMLIVLPKERHALAAVERTLDRKTLLDMVASLEDSQVALELPRFKVERGVELAKILNALGMQRAFDPAQADFGGIDDGKGRLSISRVIHRSFISVDENGTEAAAATAIVMKTWLAEAAEPIPFICDQPFLFFIIEETTGLTLFQGRCADPRG